MPNDEMRDKLAEWLEKYVQDRCPIVARERDELPDINYYEMADDLLDFFKTQPPVISDERAEALSTYKTHEPYNLFEESILVGFIEALNILGLLDHLTDANRKNE